MSDAPTLKSRLAAGKPLVGCFVMLPSPAIVEMLGYAGFDFAILDQEHGAAGVETLENQLRAADASGIEAIVRISAPTPDKVQHALDSGASGIIIPHMMNPEGAQAMVTAAQYPPFGRRGMATTARAGRHGMVTMSEHLERAAKRIMVIPQIEDREALPHVKAIGQIKGIDAVFIGPSDLSMSLGHPGNPEHPDVAGAIRQICEDTRATPTKRALFVRTPEEARKVQGELGIEMLCFSTASIISASFRSIARAVKG